MPSDVLTLLLANDPAEISRVATEVEAFCQLHDVPAAAVNAVNVSLEELLANTMSYGYGDAAAHSIELRLRRQDDALLIDIIDDAQPFDPTQTVAPDLDAPLQDRQIGGLGLYLVQQMMDEVRYRYEGGRNHLHLSKRIAGE